MINKNSNTFLNSLQNHLYKGDKHVACAIEYISKAIDPVQADFRVKILTTTLKNWDKTIRPKPHPEAIISCLAGIDFNKIEKTDFVNMFGKKSYALAKKMNGMPKDFSEMLQFFKNNSEDISYICLASATELLGDILFKPEKYSHLNKITAINLIKNQIDMGTATEIKNKQKLCLNKDFEGYRGYFTMLPKLVNDSAIQTPN